MLDGLNNQFVYTKHFFLQRMREELHRVNRTGKSFLCIEFPLDSYAYDKFMQTPWRHSPRVKREYLDAWKIIIQTIFGNKSDIDIVGQKSGGLALLLPNGDFNLLNKINIDIENNLKEAGLFDLPNIIKLRVLFYSGRKQNMAFEENRFMTNWNKTNKLFHIKRLVPAYINRKSERIFKRAVKRAIDLAGSIFGICLFSLVMLACALCVKFAILKWKKEKRAKGEQIDSKDNSVIFRQIRVGRNGKLFYCYKFRTMYPGADKEKESLKKKQIECGDISVNRGPAFKMENDPRILKFCGNFLRKHSLDELPQFFNVLKGDMSLVGPRPPTHDEVRKYEAWHYMRLSVKPGLTCLWQIGGRSDLDFDEWMRLDNKYINTNNTTMDFKIKLKTIEVMVSGKGAS